MKHLWVIVVLLLALLLCACGGAAPSNAPAEAAAPAAPDAPAGEKQSAPRVITDDVPIAAGSAPPAAPAAAEASAAPEQPAAPDDEENEQLQIALTYVGETPEALFAAIGYPENSDYASSCLGSGEDGNLYYDGFTVYTYRENGVETIRYVE